MSNANRQNVQLDRADYQARISQIQTHLAAQACDGLLLLNAANIMWACGFFHIPNERPLALYIPSAAQPLLLAPFLEKENAEASGVGEVKTYWEFPGEIPPEVWMLQQVPGERIGVDGVGHGRFLQMQQVKPKLQLDQTVAELRYIKSEGELALIKLAAG